MSDTVVISEGLGKTIYLDSGTIIKSFGPNAKKSEVLNAAMNMAMIEETGLHIPSVKEVRKVDDGWAVTYDYIAGRDLREIIDSEPEKEDEYLKMFVDIQSEIHSKTALKLPSVRDRLNTDIASADLDAVTRYELHARLDKLPRESQICHGDFIPENVILKDGNPPYILDWSHACKGNPDSDAAKTYISFKLQSRDETAEKYKKIYFEKNGTDENQFIRWISVVAAAVSSRETGERKEKLLKMIDIFQYD